MARLTFHLNAKQDGFSCGRCHAMLPTGEDALRHHALTVHSASTARVVAEWELDLHGESGDARELLIVPL